MAFHIGNFNVDEVLQMVAQDSSDNILYTLNELQNANIDITADSTDYTDKFGNVIRTVYHSKSGELTATNAMMNINILNAGSGSDIKYASSTSKIQMPKIEIVDAGNGLSVAGAKEGTVKVIAIFSNGASEAVAKAEEQIQPAAESGVYGSTAVLPDLKVTDAVQYLVRYERDVESGIEMVNNATTFPSALKLTAFCSYYDPCSDDLKPLYIVMPRFVPDPNMTIALDRDSQTVDYKGKIDVQFCGTDKALYYLYMPEENVVIPAVAATTTTSAS